MISIFIYHQAEEARSAKSKLAQDLNSAQDQVKKLNEKVSLLETKNSSKSDHLQDKIDELSRANFELESKAKELNVSIKKQTSELSRMSEENDRLSEQLAANVERPIAEGQEANGTLSPKQNGDHAAAAARKSEALQKSASPEENVWQQKYLAISQEHEKT